MSDYFVCAANKSTQCTHHEGRVWQKGAGLFIDVLPHTKVDTERERMRRGRSKDRGELTGHSQGTFYIVQFMLAVIQATVDETQDGSFHCLWIGLFYR